MIEDFEQIHANARLVVVHVAGGVNHYLAGCFFAIHHFARFGLRRLAAEFFGRQFGQPCVLVHAQSGLHHRASGFGFVDGVDGLNHNGNACKLAMHIGGGQQFFAGGDFTLLKLDGLGPQHGVGEVEVPFVRRHIRAFGQVAQVAQIALVDHFPVVFFVHAIHFKRGAFVNQIEQGGKRAAKAHTTAAAMANIEDTLHFGEASLFVIEIGIEPV